MTVCPTALPPLAQRLKAEALEQAIPLSGTFELTPRCNFNCKMCYVHLGEKTLAQQGDELSPDEWIRIAKEARDAGMLFLCITGGEPLLYPGFEELYRAVAQMGFYITIQTNAALINERFLHLFESYPPSLFKISVYGSCNEIYQEVCGLKNGFDLADAGIRALQTLNVPIQLTTTVIHQNKEDLPRIWAYTQRLGLPWYYSSTVYPSLRGSGSELEGVSLSEADATDYRQDVRRMLSFPPRKPNDKPCEHCDCYRTGFVVSWNGFLRFCLLLTEPNIPIKEYPFSDAWAKLIRYEMDLQWPKECLTCEIKEICRVCVASYATRSGRLDRTDPLLCQKLKKYIKDERENDAYV